MSKLTLLLTQQLRSLFALYLKLGDPHGEIFPETGSCVF